MRIHYYKQFFSGPEAVGTQQPRELVTRLAKRGHQVDVIAGNTNPYDERTEPAEEMTFGSGGRVNIHRYYSPRGMRRSLGRRLLTYLTFAARAGAAGLTLARPDVVIGSIQPLFTGLAGLGVAKAARAPLVLEVRDLWPDALEAKGAVTGWKLSPLYAMADALYQNATRIVSLTPGIKKELLKKGLPNDHIDVLPNGFDPVLFQVDESQKADVRSKYGWGDKFVALYTGTHTEVTSVETIVKAAAELCHRENIRLDLFGQGQTKPDAMALASRLGLTNIHFHDPVPKPQIPAIIAAADVCLMTLFRSSLVHIYFENKFMDYMGSGKAILGAMEGEQADLIRAYDLGQVVPAFDATGLAQLLREARENPDKRRRWEENGRDFVHRYLLLDRIMERYVNVVEAAAEGTTDGMRAWEPFL